MESLDKVLARKIKKHIVGKGLLNCWVGDCDIYVITSQNTIKWYRGVSVVNIITLGFARLLFLPSYYIACERKNLAENVAAELRYRCEAASSIKFHQSYIDEGIDI
jgi:hypothetical protein